MEEIHKALNDLALNAARGVQSEETGFVHGYYGKKEPPHQAILFLENALFVLTLFRTKTVEGIQEGKKILEKLLAYQSPEGLFPSFFHEFPFCYDRYIGAHCLPPLYLIYHYFHMYLGQSLEGSLEQAIRRLIEKSMVEVSVMPFSFQVKLGGSLIGCGRQWNEESWVKKGEELLAEDKLRTLTSCSIPAELGNCLLGAMLAGGDYFYPLLELFSKKWHPVLQRYIGPFDAMFFTEGEQNLSLFDLFMWASDGKIPQQMTAYPSQLLNGALLFPVAAGEQVRAVVDKEKHTFVSGERWGYSWSEKSLGQVGCYPFVFQWDDAFIALYAPRVKELQFDGNHQIQVNLGSCPNLESKEESCELNWYLSLKEGRKILINGQPATTFRANDVVSIEDEDK